MTQTRDLIKKMADFFKGEEFYEKGEDARLKLSPDDVRCMSYLIQHFSVADDCKNCPLVTPHKKLAHWIGEEYDGYADGAPVYTSWVCSECGATFMCEDMDFLYCPRCGSVMEV